MNTARPIGSFDLTGRCPLRCRHCYMFNAEQHAPDLPDAEYLAALDAAVAQFGIRSAFFIGGEPLLRVPLLLQAVRRFRRSAVATSGMLSIPRGVNTTWLISLDGLPHHHDALRGSGAFANVQAHLGALPKRTFLVSLTLTAQTLEAISDIPALCERVGALGVWVGFFTGSQTSPMAVLGDARNRAVDALQALRAAHPETLLNPAPSLEYFRPAAGPRPCEYTHSAVAFDAAMRRKLPCSFGDQADCQLCGCGVVAAHWARAQGDGESLGVLRQIFSDRHAPAA